MGGGNRKGQIRKRATEGRGWKEKVDKVEGYAASGWREEKISLLPIQPSSKTREALWAMVILGPEWRACAYITHVGVQARGARTHTHTHTHIHTHTAEQWLAMFICEQRALGQERGLAKMLKSGEYVCRSRYISVRRDSLQAYSISCIIIHKSVHGLWPCVIQNKNAHVWRREGGGAINLNYEWRGSIMPGLQRHHLCPPTIS